MQHNQRLGMWLMCATAFIFAVQDGISRHLAGEYNVLMIVMIRYWFFAAFVITVARRKTGSIRAAAKTSQPVLQISRGLLLAGEICIMVAGFVALGLVESHAIFASYPLLIAALSGPVLGEAVGWRRWLAIGFGFVGVLIILEPGYGVFTPAAMIPLAAALMLGADGVVVGSRFWASEEALVHPAMLKAAIEASGDDTLRSTVTDIMRGYDWPKRYTGRVLRNEFTDRWHCLLYTSPSPRD